MLLKPIKKIIRRLINATVFDPIRPQIEIIRFKRFIKPLVKRCLPLSLAIELTNSCNLKCAKCSTYTSGRPNGFMHEGMFLKILHDIKDGGDDIKIGLSGGGESILHPKIVEYIKYCNEVTNISAIHLATNALALTPSMGRQLLDAGLSSLKLSLDFTGKSDYLQANRVDGFDTVVKHIEEFCRMKRDGGYNCETEIKVTMYKQSDKLKTEFQEKWSGIVDKIRFTELHNWLGLRGKNSAIRTKPCHWPWTMPLILWNGQITLCCFDSMKGYINMGNIKDRNLVEYWTNDPGLLSVRQGMLQGNYQNDLLKTCAACPMSDYRFDI